MKLSNIRRVGNIYTYTGMEIDFKENTIYYADIKKTFQIDSDNIEDVNECIEEHLIEINEELEDSIDRLNLKETKKIDIQYGFKIREPLSDIFKEKYKEKIQELEETKKMLMDYHEKVLNDL